jgi:hypothetical protein
VKERILPVSGEKSLGVVKVHRVVEDGRISAGNSRNHSPIALL